MPLLGFFFRFQLLCKKWTRFSFFAFSSAKKLSQQILLLNVKLFFFTKIPIENWICHATHPIRRSPLYPIEASVQRWGRWKPWPIGSVKMKDRWAAMIAGKPYVENWEGDFFWWFLWIAKYIVYTNLYINYIDIHTHELYTCIYRLKIHICNSSRGFHFQGEILANLATGSGFASQCHLQKSQSGNLEIGFFGISEIWVYLLLRLWLINQHPSQIKGSKRPY